MTKKTSTITEQLQSTFLKDKDISFVKRTGLEHKELLEPAITGYNKQIPSIQQIILTSDGKL